MAIRILTLFLLSFASYVGNAQVTLSLQEPPAGIVQKPQLWNLALIYSGSSSQSITIGLSLVDMSDNQPVFNAYSKGIVLSKGVRQIRLEDVAPVNYTYFSPRISTMSDAFIPVGQYQACYTVYGGIHEQETLTEECIPLEVLPLSPPQLSMPEDSTTLSNSTPLFSWTAPMPILLFSDLNYDLIVTKVRPDQSAATAIQENLPIYHIRRLNSMTNQYPASGNSLDTGSVYAWKIIAKNGEAFAAQSETWTFTVRPDKPEAIVPDSSQFVELSRADALLNDTEIANHTLSIKYYSFDKSHEATFKFFSLNGEEIKEVRKRVEYGNNFLAFKLDRSFTRGSSYILEMTDLQSTLYKASFRMAK